MKKIYTLVLLSLFATACLEKADPSLEDKSFLRIYDNADFNAAFTPIDMQQTVDGGYLMLASKRLPEAGSNFSGIYILKVDKTGAILNEVEDFDSQYVNPVGALSLIGGAYYFFCMDTNTQVQLVKLNSNGDTESITPIGLTYPAVSALDGANLLLLSYNNTDKVMNIAQVSIAGSVAASGNFAIGLGDNDNIDEAIIKHFQQKGKRIPFEIGRTTGGELFFNGFYNYTFTLAFVDLNQNNGEPNRAVTGYQENEGFSSVKPLTGNRFASTIFSFGTNYLLPTNPLTAASVSDILDAQEGFTLPELVPDAATKIITLSAGGKEAIVFGSNTQSKQIALLFYNEEDGTFIDNRYLGFSNPFEMGSMLQTEDGGMAICGLTYVAGRFPRLCLFKLSGEEVNDLVN
jgi:hypothetical protein